MAKKLRGNENPKDVCEIAIAIASERKAFSKLGTDAQFHPLRSRVDKLVIRYIAREMKLSGTLTLEECSRLTYVMYRVMDADLLPSISYQDKRLKSAWNSAKANYIFRPDLSIEGFLLMDEEFNCRINELRHAAVEIISGNGIAVPVPDALSALLGSLNSLSANFNAISTKIARELRSGAHARSYKSTAAEI